jgi:hypothetical protein
VSTGIFKRNILGELEEIPQRHIDYWCQLCQFPLAEGKCKDKALIQRCWDESGAVAGRWHIMHECSFIHKGQECRCNDFTTIEEAFRAAGLEYRTEGGKVDN